MQGRLMFGSETLEVAIGLAVLFSLLSLFASSFRESIEAFVKDRAKFVHDAIEELFSTAGEADTGAITEFYENIIISPTFRGTYDGRRRNLPSYIPSGDFASAVLDMAHQQAAAAGTAITAANTDWIQKVSSTRLAELLRVAFRTAHDDPEQARLFIEHWFDGQMDRVSGWYKRRTQIILLAIGMACAIVLNVDAIAITQHLYRNDALRQLIVARAQSASHADTTKAAANGAPASAQGVPASAQAATSNAASAAPPGTDAFKAPREALDQLSGYGFPIGWAWNNSVPVPAPQCALRGQLPNTCTLDPGTTLFMILGWVITAFGISLGAPFWFDLLDKFMVVRSTVKPFEKSPPAASEDRQPSTGGTAGGHS